MEKGFAFWIFQIIHSWCDWSCCMLACIRSVAVCVHPNRFFSWGLWGLLDVWSCHLLAVTVLTSFPFVGLMAASRTLRALWNAGTVAGSGSPTLCAAHCWLPRPCSALGVAFLAQSLLLSVKGSGLPCCLWHMCRCYGFAPWLWMWGAYWLMLLSPTSLAPGERSSRRAGENLVEEWGWRNHLHCSLKTVYSAYLQILDRIELQNHLVLIFLCEILLTTHFLSCFVIDPVRRSVFLRYVCRGACFRVVFMACLITLLLSRRPECSF